MRILDVIASLRATLWRLLTTPYTPDPTLRTFASRAQTQENASAQVTVAVLDAAESAQLFGVPLARRGIQPVHLRIENRSDKLLRLLLVEIDPNYYTPLEAAGVCHFSIFKRLSAFGLVGCAIYPFAALASVQADHGVSGQPADGRLFSVAGVPSAADSTGRHVAKDSYSRRSMRGRRSCMCCSTRPATCWTRLAVSRRTAPRIRAASSRFRFPCRASRPTICERISNRSAIRLRWWNATCRR